MKQHWRRLLPAMVLAVLMTSGRLPAFADDSDDCAEKKGDVAIAACSRAIASGHWKGADQADNFYNRGLDYYAKGDHARALADFSAAIGIDPTMFDAYDDRGNVYYAKHDYDRAIADYSVAIKLSPKDPRAYHNRGTAYVDQGDRERAFADFSSAIRLDPQQADTLYSRGLIYKERGDLDHALADFEAAARLDPDDADTQTQIEAVRATLKRH
jgi:tetratricopeptide (TPR) repeat protein